METQAFKQAITDICHALVEAGKPVSLRFMRNGRAYIYYDQPVVPGVACELRPVSPDLVEMVLRGHINKYKGYDIYHHVRKELDGIDIKCHGFKRTSRKVRD